MLNRRAFVSAAATTLAIGVGQPAEARFFGLRRRCVSTSECWRRISQRIECCRLSVRVLNIPDDPENYSVGFRTHTDVGFNLRRQLRVDGTVSIPCYSTTAFCWVDLFDPQGTRIDYRGLSGFDGGNFVFDLNQPQNTSSTRTPLIQADHIPRLDATKRVPIRVIVRDRFGFPVTRCEWRHREHDQPVDPPFVPLGSCAFAKKEVIMKYTNTLYVDMRRSDASGKITILTTAKADNPTRESYEFTLCDRVCG